MKRLLFQLKRIFKIVIIINITFSFLLYSTEYNHLDKYDYPTEEYNYPNKYSPNFRHPSSFPEKNHLKSK